MSLLTIKEIRKFAKGRTREEIKAMVRELVELENERGKAYGYQCIKFDLGDFPYFTWLLEISRAALEILPACAKGRQVRRELKCNVNAEAVI